MKQYSILDHINSKWYNKPKFSIIPLIRKTDGNKLQCHNCKIMICWLWFRVYLDKYFWGLNKAFNSKFSIDTPFFRIVIL
jgi:hypothetical protein